MACGTQPPVGRACIAGSKPVLRAEKDVSARAPRRWTCAEAVRVWSLFRDGKVSAKARNQESAG